MGKVIVYLIRAGGVVFWSLLNRIKLNLVGKVGGGLRAEGPIYFPGIQGKITVGSFCEFGPHVLRHNEISFIFK